MEAGVQVERDKGHTTNRIRRSPSDRGLPTFHGAEVDIVARQGNLLIFVEVKTRESPYLSDPALMVPMRKQRQIIKASDAFSKEYSEDLPARFDIISIVTNSQYTKIDHIEEAFYPTV